MPAPAIVGEMGYGRATSVTAIGDAVNTASRLEGLTKEYGCQLVVSETVARRPASISPSASATRSRSAAGASGSACSRSPTPGLAGAGSHSEAGAPVDGDQGGFIVGGAPPMKTGERTCERKRSLPSSPRTQSATTSAIRMAGSDGSTGAPSAA